MTAFMISAEQSDTIEALSFVLKASHLFFTGDENLLCSLRIVMSQETPRHSPLLSCHANLKLSQLRRQQCVKRPADLDSINVSSCKRAYKPAGLFTSVAYLGMLYAVIYEGVLIRIH